MMSDFDMIVHAFPEDVTIIPVADVHLGARECMERDFAAFLNWVKETENVYLVLCGDLINNGVKNSVTNIYEETLMPSQAKRLMANYLEPVRDRILAAVGGNHERRSSREVDDDITLDIMAKLDCEHLYRENLAFVKIQLGEKYHASGSLRKYKDRPTYCLAVAHGAGGGMTGGAVNRNERFAYALENVDAVITGHTHRPAFTQPAKIHVDLHNNKVTVKPFRVITASSWLRYSGYPAQKLLTPTSFVKEALTLKAVNKEMVVTFR
jgi:UDP-2,3-diacylglucosamine pyrophosphatase LpxH